MKLEPKSLIAVDLDGTLSEGTFWGKEDPKPKKEMIDMVEKLYRKGHHIIIYTARHRKYFERTEAWLIKHGVYYHALSMDKMGADVYIDDKAMTPEEFLQLKLK